MNTRVKNLNISYSKKGSGPALVLLHGWGSSKETFNYLAGSLADHFTVIALDFPGFGGSELPANAWSVGDYAQFVADFIAQLEINEVHAYIAHSFGGRVCIKGVADGVLKPEKLVLIGSAGVKYSNSVRNILYALVAKVGKVVFSIPGLKKYSAAARTQLYQSAKSQDYLSAGTMRQIFVNAINEDLTPLLNNVHVPTLLLWGSEDNQAPLADARVMQKNIPNVTLRIQQRAGHFVHTEQPQKVAAWVAEFLQ